MDSTRDTTGRGRPGSVLVGAADADLVRQIRQTLEADGHGVTAVAGPDALRGRFAPSRTELLILAFDAMGSDGFSLCRELRRSDGSAAVPILVVAENDAEEAVDAAFAAGANDVLARPLNRALLRHRVGELLRTGRSLAELRDSRSSLESAQRIAGIGSWQLEVETRAMRWSPQTFRVLGLAPGEMETTLATFAGRVHPKDRSSVTRQIESAIAQGGSFDLGHRIVLRGGSVRHVQLRGESVAADAGRVRLQGTLQDVTDQYRAQERIRYLAHYDSLTGLSNRRRFKEQLERAIERARSRERHIALLYMDLDQFKRINDTLGHSAGDKMLQHVSEVLFDRVRTTDIISRNVGVSGDIEVSRLGGDEFAIVLSEISEPDDAGQVAHRILSAVTAPIDFEEHQISTTASIGIAIYPTDGEDAETLVKHADTAMYKAKERGRNVHEFYSRAMGAGTLRKLNLETHLRGALERGEFHLLYQPRVDLRAQRVAGVEALLRWQNAELGAVLPKEFIPVAEETGLIVPIGEWVIETACAQAVAWRNLGHADLGISVNVSSRQFVHNDIRETVSNALTRSGLDPRRLEIEITETAILEDDVNTGSALRDLKAMGVRIALDDFGTGYSSLSYLTRFPLDTLKLDRSLVRGLAKDPTARGIATAVIAMAHAVKLAVTAEGVDDVAQARVLTEEGCDEMQGFLVAGPMDPADCEPYFVAPPKAFAGLFAHPPADDGAPVQDEADLPALRLQSLPRRRRSRR